MATDGDFDDDYIEIEEILRLCFHDGDASLPPLETSTDCPAPEIAALRNRDESLAFNDDHNDIEPILRRWLNDGDATSAAEISECINQGNDLLGKRKEKTGNEDLGFSKKVKQSMGNLSFATHDSSETGGGRGGDESSVLFLELERFLGFEELLQVLMMMLMPDAELFEDEL